jgi:hypothetical protein
MQHVLALPPLYCLLLLPCQQPAASRALHWTSCNCCPAAAPFVLERCNDHPASIVLQAASCCCRPASNLLLTAHLIEYILIQLERSH